jgi:hypothetical protein
MPRVFEEASMAGKDDGSSSKSTPMLYRVRLRTADGREVMSKTAAVVEGPLPEQPPGASDTLQLYRFKVRTADGKEVTSSVAVALSRAAATQETAPADSRTQQTPELEVADLRWDLEEYDHGVQASIAARIARGDEGPLLFVLEHLDGEEWKPYARLPAVRRGDDITASLSAHHPLAPPEGPAPRLADLLHAQPARLRCHVERDREAR